MYIYIILASDLKEPMLIVLSRLGHYNKHLKKSEFTKNHIFQFLVKFLIYEHFVLYINFEHKFLFLMATFIFGTMLHL